MYVCEICGFEESSQSSMEAQIERTHTCSECQTMFKDVYELNRHRENFHSREFKCNSCAFKSKSEQDYKTHLQTQNIAVTCVENKKAEKLILKNTCKMSMLRKSLNILGAVQVSRDHILAYSRRPLPPVIRCDHLGYPPPLSLSGK